jgi:hypothetical protein
MKRATFLHALALLLAGCSGHEEAYRPAAFAAEGMLTFQSILSLEEQGITRPTGMVKRGRFLSIGRQGRQHNASTIDLAAGTRHDWLPRGDGEGEALAIYNLCTGGEGRVVAFDFLSGRLHARDVLHPTRAAAPPLSLASSDKHLAVAAGDTFIISTGLYARGRYRYYSIEEGTEEFFLSYPEHPAYPDLDAYTRGVLHASSLPRLRPDNKAFACIDTRSGILDICRVNGKSIERVCQHAYSYPRVRVTRDGKYPRVAYSRDNVNGFQDIAVSNDYIYALYSGKNFRGKLEDANKCLSLLVFDWEGRLARCYSLDKPASLLSYDEEEGALYGIAHLPGATLVKFNL